MLEKKLKKHFFCFSASLDGIIDSKSAKIKAASPDVELENKGGFGVISMAVGMATLTGRMEVGGDKS